MAGSNDMAIGIASALARGSPDPLRVQLRGLSLNDAACLIRAVVRECTDASILLHSVQVDAELFAWLTSGEDQSLACTLARGAEAGEVGFRRKG